jgi:hypothetical protein
MALDGVPEGAVVITTADMYRMLVDLNNKVGEIKGSLDALSSMTRAVEDHESRIRALERMRVGIPLAGLAGLGGLGTALVQLLGQ